MSFVRRLWHRFNHFYHRLADTHSFLRSVFSNVPSSIVLPPGLPCSNSAFSRELACPLCDTVLPKNGVVEFDVRPGAAALRTIGAATLGLRPRDMCAVLRAGLDFWEEQRGNEDAARQRQVRQAAADRDTALESLRKTTAALEQEKMTSRKLQAEIIDLQAGIADVERKYAEKARAARKVADLYVDLKKVHKRLRTDLLEANYSCGVDDHDLPADGGEEPRYAGVAVRTDNGNVTVDEPRRGRKEDPLRRASLTAKNENIERRPEPWVKAAVELSEKSPRTKHDQDRHSAYYLLDHRAEAASNHRHGLKRMAPAGGDPAANEHRNRERNEDKGEVCPAGIPTDRVAAKSKTNHRHQEFESRGDARQPLQYYGNSPRARVFDLNPGIRKPQKLGSSR
jgi:hypothetical protein